MAYLFWDPSRAIFSFNLPLLNRPLLWYGLLFALGFLLAYRVLVHLLNNKALAEKLVCYVVMGTVIGARLGDVLFYQSWSDYVQDPLSIFKVWEGGLASHGGVLGILISLMILAKRTGRPFLYLLDLCVVPAGLAAAFIRVGNFFNQEILGLPTTLPWAVIFGHPADGSLSVPRHPVQLYEAVYYLAVFVLLFTLWKKTKVSLGKSAGLFFSLVFTFRFFIEFLKEEQSLLLSGTSWLTMGQYLSLPLIVFGFLLVKNFFAVDRVEGN